MSELKVIILCSSRFAIPAMRDLVFNKLLCVVAIPDHCTDFIEEATSLLTGTGVPVVQVNKNQLETNLKKIIKQYNISLGFVMTFSFKVPASVYTIPQIGFFNVHSGPLPEYRGADPVFEQIKNREEKTGVTIHKLTEKFDAGDVVIREMIQADPNDTYGLLNNKLSELASRLAGTVIKMARLGITIPARPQDETKAHYYKRQTTNDISINWDTMDAETIIALINACNPWNKGAATKLNYKIIRLLEAKKVEHPVHESGTVLTGTIAAINEQGILISLRNNDWLRVTYIYADEGFLHASRIVELGFGVGGRFSNL